MKNTKPINEEVYTSVYEKIINDLLKHNYSVIDNFFTATEVIQLREELLLKYAYDRFKKAAIGNRIHEKIKRNIRGDFIFWLHREKAKPIERLFFQKMDHLIDYLNRTCFLGISHREFHYAVYPEGTFYKRHLDVFQGDDRRKLSFVCYLNDKDWRIKNGGELVLYTEKNGREQSKVITPLPGRVVIFESQQLEHEVKPVVAGERLSITGWFKTR